MEQLICELPKDKILFAKMKPGAIIPTKRAEDAGYDIYPVLDGDIVILPNQTVKVPTGIASAFHPSKVVILKERSSTGPKGLEQRCGVIDSGYRGEWSVPLTNGTNKMMVITNDPDCYQEHMWVIIPAHKAITQAILFDLPESTSEEVSIDYIRSIVSERGTGGFGSSGK